MSLQYVFVLHKIAINLFKNKSLHLRGKCTDVDTTEMEEAMK